VIGSRFYRGLVLLGNDLLSIPFLADLTDIKDYRGLGFTIWIVSLSGSFLVLLLFLDYWDIIEALFRDFDDFSGSAVSFLTDFYDALLFPDLPSEIIELFLWDFFKPFGFFSIIVLLSFDIIDSVSPFLSDAFKWLFFLDFTTFTDLLWLDSLDLLLLFVLLSDFSV